MTEDTPFVDYYTWLEIDPGCDQREVELAFHRLAKLYHPDAGESADIERFSDVTQAYRVLRDAGKRAEFDIAYERMIGGRHTASAKLGMHADLPDAASDAQTHGKMLLQLYRRRRTEPGDPGVPAWLLEETLGCSESQFEFHVWYLKAKGFIHTTEQGTIAITIEGVDHVIANSQTEEARKLLFAPHDQAG